MAASITGKELMQDPAFARKVDHEWDVVKKGIKDKVQNATKSFKRSIPDRYVEALKIHLEYIKYRDAMQWDNAFYCLHLYLACVLDKSLHRPLKEPPYYTKQAKDVLETLQELQDNLNNCMIGIRKQIIEKHRREFVKNGGKLENKAASTSPKRASYSASQARLALDALRIDGKKTTDVKLYGMDLGKQTISQPATPPAAPPPSYNQAVENSSSKYINTRGRSMGYGNTKQYRVKKVLGDGNCAFRSIVQGMHGGLLNSQQELQQAMKLRSSVAQELRRCANEEMTGTGLTVEQLVLMKDSIYPTYNEYVNAMARSTYAGETEFWLLARKLGINIAIFQPNTKGGGGYEHLITYGTAETPPVMLLWQRGASEAGNHYDALLP